MRESEDEKAVRIIAQGNSKVEVSKIDLDEFSKSDSRKIRIACRLRQETTMPLRWIVESPSDGECSIHLIQDRGRPGDGDEKQGEICLGERG